MLQLSHSLIDKAVLSLRTGAPVAKILSPIVNPDNLKIEGYYCEDRFNKQRLVLLSQDIRDIMPNGYVINDHDVLSEPDDLVRLQKVMELNFNLIGKQVITSSQEKIGKVTDYAAETGSMMIQKIYVSQSILKNLTGASLSIDRSQIQEITPKRIIVNDLLDKVHATAAAAA
jgi:sporulation protein YlmC with PRC-barrel domain